MDGRLIIENKRVETYLRLKSINPANLKPVGEVFLASTKECQQAIQAAKNAFPSWRELPLREKRRIFHKAKLILLQRSSEAARLITAEKGSPYPESLSIEIQAVLEALDYYGQNLGRATQPRKMKHHVILFSNKKSFFRFQPLGVTLIISPWNFPFLIPFCDILGSLSAGNTVVFRPSTSTPFTGLLIGDILTRAGLPPGVLNVVNCNVLKAEKMILSPEVQTISFTGSVATGKRISELASRNLTHTVLELGGKDPMVVLKDADLERASRGAVWAAFMNSGQSCGSVERLYVAREIADDYVQRVLNLVRELKVGDPLAPEVDMGPMTTLSQLKTVEEHVKDAVDKGAQVLHGGTRAENLPGYFFQPTVLTGVNHSMKVMREETFGPVLPIMVFSDPEEAVSLANDSDYGLTASVWTRSKKMAAWMAERIETGTVTVNDHMFSFAEPGAIWGGIKQTGRGHSHGTYGLQEVVNIQFCSYDFSRKKSQIWWYPYSADLPQLLEKSLVLFHHDRLLKKLKALFSLLPYRSRILSGSPLLNFLKNLPKLFKR
ncbi:MAG: aldehyde dehydrogenase family protein [Candidatus Aminicenantes bacterium]|nr:aldehyde dehydrogenase family protein [Candidatus Aminicenantes bacterium]MDH5704520.1 aldehyde dehydrogenase family protein [Candidatus Aminicenantes bacterium]